MDWQTDKTKLIVTFHNFASATKIGAGEVNEEEEGTGKKEKEDVQYIQ